MCSFHPFIMLYFCFLLRLNISIPAWFYLPFYFTFTLRNGLNAAVFYRQNAPQIMSILLNYLILVFIFLKGSDGDDVEIFTLHNGHSLWFLFCSLIGEVLLEISVRSCIKSFSCHTVLALC